MKLYRHLHPLRVHPIHKEVVSGFLTSPSLHTIIKETSDPFTDSCAWTNYKEQNPEFPIEAPSTTMHSVKTCPEVRGRGFATRPLQAGHQICLAYPGLGALFPIGDWSISHWHSTFGYEFKKIKSGEKKCVQR